MAATEQKFNFFVPAEMVKGAHAASADGDRIIQGIASTPAKDLQGEIVDPDGIDVSYFLKSGYLNNDHKPGAENKVGEPIECKITKDGLWIKGRIFKGKKVCDDIWEHFQALNKSNSKRRMGFSIEGRVIRRNGNVIEKCWIQDVAITPAPVNPTTWAEVVKSLNAPKKEDASLSRSEVMSLIKSFDSSLDESAVNAVADLLVEEQRIIMSQDSKGISPVMKALEALRDFGEKVEKGHASGNTPTTKVESYTSESGATQLFHTPSNSEPSSWAGSMKQSVSMEDHIDANGTDVSVGAVRKSIVDMLAKGQITADQAVSLLKALDKPGKGEPDGDEGYEDGDDDEKEPKGKPEFAKGKGKKVAKSFEEDVAASDEIVEVGPALEALVGILTKSFASLEQAIVAQGAKQDKFSKSLATATANLAEAVLTTSGRVDAVEASPARGPKSAREDAVIAKSVPANHTRDEIAEALFQLRTKNQCTDQDVLVFDSTGRIEKSLQAKVIAHLEGK